jgi:uncharacterized membrane protein
MTDQRSNPPSGEITDNDKLLAALSYPIPILAVVILLVADMKNRPFQRYHAVQALAVNVALWVIMVVLGFLLWAVTFWLVSGACGSTVGILWLVTLYFAYEAYQGKYFEIPYVTEFLRKQNWL